MDFEIKLFKDLYPHLESNFKTFFGFNDLQVKESLAELQKFLKDLKKDVVIGIESKYIDKLYRDSYYHYYSSKLREYKRDCIRLSFFNTEITIDDFHSKEGIQKLQSNFLGFLVLRPTSPKIIGRNALRPDIFTKKLPTHVSVAPVRASINGIKLSVDSFPHSSQDAEFMVCAETTLWSSMEYFANKYPEYRPVLPKRIHSLLSTTSMQRQVPSSGLTGLQISYALKEFGFGVKLYTANSHTPQVLLNMIKMYVESGIPVVTALSNNDGINHVINVVGRTQFELPAGFDFTPIKTMQSGSVLYDYYEQPSKYLTIDDNFEPYIPIPLDNPACNYIPINDKWKDCEIVAAIVPLHQRVYMEADRARQLAIQTLSMHDRLYNLPSSVIRVLLSSSRSLKHSISLNPDLDNITKTLIVNLDMPKFVWIAEVGTVDSFLNNKATGMILMDATEPKKTAILAYLLENTYIGPINDGQVSRYTLPLQPFNIHYNLNPF